MEVMKDVKLNNDVGQEAVRWIEKRVKDGPETAVLLRAMAAEYDLIIEGKRHKEEECPQVSGLTLWSELPELGVLGDLLAASDIHCRASLLVVQQQD